MVLWKQRFGCTTIQGGGSRYGGGGNQLCCGVHSLHCCRSCGKADCSFIRVGYILTCGRVILIDLVSEATIKLIDLEDTVNISILHGHNDVVRKVTWEPSGNILVCYPALQINAGRLHLSIDLLQCRWKNHCMGSYARTEAAQTYRRHHPCCQGQGVRWSQLTRLRMWSDVFSSSRDFAHDCSAVWHPSGQYLIVASRTHGVWDVIGIHTRLLTFFPLRNCDYCS